MTKQLWTFLDIRPEETRRFSLLFLAFFVYSVGLTWGGNAIKAEVVNLNDSLNLQTEFLPIAQMAGGFIVIFTSLIYTAYVDRVSKSRMLILMTGLLTIAVGAATAIQVLDWQYARAASYLSLYAIYQILFSVWMIHWGTYIISIYDTRSAKRIFPVISAAFPLATMFGGAIYSTLIKGTYSIPTFEVMFIWVGLLIIVIIVFILTTRTLRRHGDDGTSSSQPYAVKQQTKDAPKRETNFESLREGLRFVLGNRYPRMMATGTLLFLSILTLFEYQTAVIIERNAANADAFGQFTAALESGASAVALIVQLFLFNRIMRRIGLGNMNLVFPSMVLISAFALIVYPQLLSSALALIVIGAFRRVFSKPVGALMGNALPAQSKGRARAVISGLISPLGTILASGLLQLLPIIPFDWFLPALIGVNAVLYLMNAINLRREYTRSMVNLLQSDSFSYLLTHPPELEIDAVDSRTLDRLLFQMNSNDDPNFKVFIASIILQIGGRDGALLLASLLDDVDSDLRAQLLEILVDSEVRDEKLRRTFKVLLKDENEQTRQLALAGLAYQENGSQHDFLSIAEGYLLNDPSPIVRAEAIPVLLHADQASQREIARTAHLALLNSDQPDERILGIQIIQTLNDVNGIGDLLAFQEDVDDAVRLQATQAIETLWQEELPDDIYQKVVAKIDLLFNDPVESIRLVELRILSRIHSAQAYLVLVAALIDPSNRVRDLAIELLIAIGRPAIPALETALKSTDTRQAQRAAVALNRIDLQKYDHHLKTAVEDSLNVIYRDYLWIDLLTPYTAYPGVAVVESMLKADISSRREEVFYLLGMMTDPNSLQIIQESLQTNDPRRRSNAVEALESITTPHIARLIAPLVRENVTTKQLLKNHPTTALNQPKNGYALLMALTKHQDAGLRMFSLYALGEITMSSDDATGNTHRAEKDAAFAVLQAALQDENPDVRLVVQMVIRHMQGSTILDQMKKKMRQNSNGKGRVEMLSIVEKMIMLRRVSFFESIPIDHLKSLAGICDEQLIKAEEVIFREGDPGGELFIVVSGGVKIGKEDIKDGAFIQFASYRPVSAFGEMTLFDESKRSATAITEEDTLVLLLRREPLTALLYQYPDLSLKMMHVLSDHLRQANEKITALSNGR
ncbi:MAG: HEAT repeat domain-containing protein [Aggregatilineales bacterium]